MITALAPIAARVILPIVRTERAVPPAEVAGIIAQISPELSVTTAESLENTLNEAQTSPERVLLTGSLHFAGESLALLAGDPDALEDCLQ
jgi:folylpolyglutamate synthase/dihydropteroate synthase